MNQLQPCPAALYGGDRQCCECPLDIPTGSPARKNQFGQWQHPDCSALARAASTPANAAQQTMEAVEGPRPGETQSAYARPLPGDMRARSREEFGSQVADVVERLTDTGKARRG